MVVPSLAALAAEGLVDFVDAFCEMEGVGFSVAQTGRVFDAATQLGLPSAHRRLSRNHPSRR